MHQAVLAICGKGQLLFFAVFIGYIFKGAGGASVQWIGSLKKKMKVQTKVWTFCYYTVLIYLNNFTVCYKLKEETQAQSWKPFEQL